MSAPLIPLNKSQISRLLKTKSIHVDVLAEVNSTNDYLKSFCRGSRIRACIAETQTHGKGRMRRQWHSPFGQNIYLSLLYPFNKDMSQLAGLSLIIGLSICQGIENVYQLPKPSLVKWPNDVIYDNKKLAGSLIEIQTETSDFCYVIIGIGVNVNMTEAQNQQINQEWTSIQKINNQYNDRNVLCSELINQLIIYIEKFKQNGLAAFIDEWKSTDGLLNKLIRLNSANNEYSGIVQGINEQGHLIIKQENGECLSFSSGDTSIIKNLP